MHLKTAQLIRLFEEALAEHYPKGRFAFAELAGVVQAVVNAVGWAALRSDSDGKGVSSLGGVRHDLSNPWMKRHQILNLIECTSGLDAQMSSLALDALSRRIASTVTSGDALSIEHVGSLTREGDETCVLVLSEELRLAAPAVEKEEYPRHDPQPGGGSTVTSGA